ncbi:hypothetical protein BMJ22_26425, partial [Sinorhizobium medicae]
MRSRKLSSTPTSGGSSSSRSPASPITCRTRNSLDVEQRTALDHAFRRRPHGPVRSRECRRGFAWHGSA